MWHLFIPELSLVMPVAMGLLFASKYLVYPSSLWKNFVTRLNSINKCILLSNLDILIGAKTDSLH